MRDVLTLRGILTLRSVLGLSWVGGLRRVLRLRRVLHLGVLLPVLVALLIEVITFLGLTVECHKVLLEVPETGLDTVGLSLHVWKQGVCDTCLRTKRDALVGLPWTKEVEAASWGIGRPPPVAKGLWDAPKWPLTQMKFR